MTDETSTPPAEESTPGIDIGALQRELETYKAKSAEYLDGWQRARAEFANYKRRVDREQADAQYHIAGRILLRYLEVADDLERALKSAPTENEGAVWAEGVAAVARKFQSVLDSEGVERFQSVGLAFDPNYHEAILQEDSDTVPSGHVTEELRAGYKLKDRVLRTALVKVAK